MQTIKADAKTSLQQSRVCVARSAMDFTTMKILCILGLLVVVVTSQAPKKGGATCEGGVPAREVGDSFCCQEDGVEYCCKKDNPYCCTKKPMGSGTEASKGREAEDPERRPEVQGAEPPAKPSCALFEIPKTVTARFKMSDQKSPLSRTATLTLSQVEGCEEEPRMTVRLTGADPGQYRVMVGESEACGGKSTDQTEVASIGVKGLIASAQVPSRVPKLLELRDQPVTLMFSQPGAQEEVPLCGQFRTLTPTLL